MSISCHSRTLVLACIPIYLRTLLLRFETNFTGASVCTIGQATKHTKTLGNEEIITNKLNTIGTNTSEIRPRICINLKDDII
jgi:hypothetical protein